MKGTKDTDWKKLRLEYVNSSITYEALTEKYELKPCTIRQRANRDNPKWEEECHELSRQVTLEVQTRTGWRSSPKFTWNRPER